MTVQPGQLVRPIGVTAFYHEDTILANLTSSSYEAGSPEVGVYFVGPASGAVRVTVGGGARENGGATTDRIFLTVQIFEESSAGTEFLAPSVTLNGFAGSDANTEFQYGCRVSLVDGLEPGRLYYARTMHLTSSGTDPDTADIASRDLIVIPVP